ncbi:TPA: right-handed parallel beta-helix repeat-containing protein, partial [Legionella pneumophila]
MYTPISDYDAIIIQANNVILDGNGYLLKGPGTSTTLSRGIVAYNRQNIIVKNIIIDGFYIGILFADNSLPSDTLIPINYFISNSIYNFSQSKPKNIIIQNVAIESSIMQGIYIKAYNFIIKNSRIIGVGPNSNSPHSFATGIYSEGNLCSIESNTISLGYATGNGENVGIALYGGIDCRIKNNHIIFARWPMWGRNFGIWSKSSRSGHPVIENNFIRGAHYALGPFGLFSGNIAVNLSCAFFVQRKNKANQFFDLGKNVAVMQSSVNEGMGGNSICPDNRVYAAYRFIVNPGAFSAYSAAMAWGEGGEETLIETYAWFLVASYYKHELALNIVNNPFANGYSENVVSKAKIIADKIFISGILVNVFMRLIML